MEHQKQPQRTSSDEIDLGELLGLIKKGLKSVFNSILGVFLYFKKNVFILGGLVVLGVALGLALNALSTKVYKTEVIVKPNFESKDYVYNTVDEIDANIRTRDTMFFRALDIDFMALKSFKITIQPIAQEENEKNENNREEDLKYLELLQNFKTENFALDVIKEEIFKKSEVNQRITFTYKNSEAGKDAVVKLLNYLNSSIYFKEVSSISRQNIQSRITKNIGLIGQIDELVASYTKSLSRPTDATKGAVYLEQENGLNIASLLSLKNMLIKDIEDKQIELIQTKEVVNVISLGNSQTVKKRFLQKNIVLIPIVLLGLFFLYGIVKYLNRKAAEL